MFGLVFSGLNCGPIIMFPSIISVIDRVSATSRTDVFGERRGGGTETTTIDAKANTEEGEARV
jgi:hypothetical protein